MVYSVLKETKKNKKRNDTVMAKVRIGSPGANILAIVSAILIREDLDLKRL